MNKGYWLEKFSFYVVVLKAYLKLNELIANNKTVPNNPYLLGYMGNFYSNCIVIEYNGNIWFVRFINSEKAFVFANSIQTAIPLLNNRVSSGRNFAQNNN